MEEFYSVHLSLQDMLRLPLLLTQILFSSVNKSLLYSIYVLIFVLAIELRTLNLPSQHCVTDPKPKPNKVYFKQEKN